MNHKHRSSSVNFAKFLRIPFSQNTSGATSELLLLFFDFNSLRISLGNLKKSQSNPRIFSHSQKKNWFSQKLCKLIENTCNGALFSRLTALLKELYCRCFPMNITKFFKTDILYNTLWDHASCSALRSEAVA